MANSDWHPRTKIRVQMVSPPCIAEMSSVAAAVFLSFAADMAEAMCCRVSGPGNSTDSEGTWTLSGRPREALVLLDHMLEALL